MNLTRLSCQKRINFGKLSNPFKERSFAFPDYHDAYVCSALRHISTNESTVGVYVR